MSAKFAPVAPINILEKLLAFNAFGSYHLFLAHHTVAEAARFRALMAGDKNSRAMGAHRGGYKPDPVVIMDNSIIELGTALDANLVLDAAELVDAKYVVIPDVFHDHNATTAMIYEGLATLSKRSHKRKYMIVAQGNTLREYLSVVEEFAKYAEIGCIGIPRNTVKALGTRRELIELTKIAAPTVQIHLLGFSDNVLDDIVCARQAGVMGIDSAVPVRMGSEGYEMKMSLHYDKPRGDWWDNAAWDPVIIRNIARMNTWVKGLI